MGVEETMKITALTRRDSLEEMPSFRAATQSLSWPKEFPRRFNDTRVRVSRIPCTDTGRDTQSIIRLSTSPAQFTVRQKKTPTRPHTRRLVLKCNRNTTMHRKLKQHSSKWNTPQQQAKQNTSHQYHSTMYSSTSHSAHTTQDNYNNNVHACTGNSSRFATYCRAVSIHKLRSSKDENESIPQKEVGANEKEWNEKNTPPQGQSPPQDQANFLVS